MPAIASISNICLFKAFSLSSARSVKDQTLFQRCNFPVIREPRQQIPLINDCMVFAEMPERTGIGVPTYFHGAGTWEDGIFVRSYLVTNQLIRILKFCSDEGCGPWKELPWFFMEYESLGIKPNSYTYSTMLAICRILSALEEGKQLHAQVLKMQCLSETAVSNALLAMYCKCEAMADAESVFERIPQRNIISWTTIINGLYQHEVFEKAMRQFYLMRESGIEPNEYTFTIALASCGSMKNVDNGRLLHALVIRKGMALGEFVGTAIVDMYSELGLTDDPKKQFKEMGNVASKVSRNALIKGHSGKIQDGYEIFQSMIREFGILPEQAHYSCMVDLLGRSGQIEKALDFISNMPIKLTASICRPLLAA
ncbi:putative Tetratricopeptide repeat (TPR)-like superfamily protein [Hibiscus syriacus]|uniref:Tetratricopeptide repeat (TPR)-like superfamily protein n=1 Tax=Hibiscus syriacus TaxID=106335 RepID=A0A6A2ZZX5_HIBSY|nr:putative Tetratricopeptide repeat (TPR)-like superfamily protein [Hibiscus syriacus]